MVRWIEEKHSKALEGFYNAFSEQEILEFEALLKKKIPLSTLLLRRFYHALFEVVALLKAPSQAPFAKRHALFLKKLRLSLKAWKHLNSFSLKDETFLKAQSFLETLCHKRYLGVSFFQLGKKVLREVFEKSTSLHKVTAPETFALFSKVPREIQVPFWRTLLKVMGGELNFFFDPTQYNHPFFLYELHLKGFFGEEKKIQVIRTGTCSRSYFGRAQVIEEFEGFLSSLASKDQRHLYLNKQRSEGMEGEHAKALKALAQHNRQYTFISLPSDGPFYRRSFKNLESFRKTLFRNVKENLQGFYFPDYLRDDVLFYEKLQEVFEQVLEDIWIPLKGESYPLLVEHLYTHWIVLFLRYLRLNTLNITCRDGIDRAGKEQTKLLVLFTYLLKRESEKEAVEEITYALHAPPFFAKGRPMVPERRAQLALALSAYQPEIVDNLRARYQKDPFLLHKPYFPKL